MSQVCEGESIMKKLVSGFTLIELLIVIAIIAILATAAFPQYKNYTNKAQVMADIASVDVYKLGVAVCYNLLGSFEGCNEGENEVPDIEDNSKVKSVNKGLITMNTIYAGEEKVIQYQGQSTGGTISWKISSDIENCDTVLKGCSTLTNIDG